MIPDPASGKPDDLLKNHVEAMREWHALGIDFESLVCAVLSQTGFTVNGAPPVRPSWCVPPIRAEP